MATYTKTLMSVEITTQSGGSFTIEDTVDNAVASSVWGLIKGRHDVLYKDGEDWQFIAFDCICSAKATITSQEVEKPEDANCKPIEVCPENGGEEP